MKPSELPWWTGHKPCEGFEYLDLDLGVTDPILGDHTFVTLMISLEDLKAFPGYRNRDLPGIKSLLMRLPGGHYIKHANTAQDFEWGPQYEVKPLLDVYDTRA